MATYRYDSRQDYAEAYGYDSPRPTRRPAPTTRTPPTGAMDSGAATTPRFAASGARARAARTSPPPPRRLAMQPEHHPATAARTRYQRRAAVAVLLGVSPDLLAHWMRRHPDGMPQPDADVEGAEGRAEPVWLLGRDAEWKAWRASFPGRTGRPRKDAQPPRAE